MKYDNLSKQNTNNRYSAKQETLSNKEDVTAMTPTEQDKELREKLTIMYFNVLTKGMTLEEVSKIGAPILKNGEEFIDDLMQLIIADRNRVALEARLDELEAKKDEAYHIWNILFNECGIQPDAPLMQKIDNRIAQLKAQQEEVE